MTGHLFSPIRTKHCQPGLAAQYQGGGGTRNTSNWDVKLVAAVIGTDRDGDANAGCGEDVFMMYSA